jgi:hypothetical protein
MSRLALPMAESILPSTVETWHKTEQLNNAADQNEKKKRTSVSYSERASETLPITTAAHRLQVLVP